MILTVRQLKDVLNEGLLQEGRVASTVEKYVNLFIDKLNSECSSYYHFDQTLVPDLARYITNRANALNINVFFKDIYSILGVSETSFGRDDTQAMGNFVMKMYITKKALQGESKIVHERSMGKYLDWMLDKILFKEESHSEVINTLEEFERYKHIQPREINSYKTLGDLRAAVEGDAAKRAEKIKVSSSEYEKMDEDEGAFIVHPFTKEAAQKYGAGTRWCIAATKSKNYFDEYAEDSAEHYFVIRKKPKGDEWDKISVSAIFRTEDEGQEACHYCLGRGWEYGPDGREACYECKGRGFKPAHEVAIFTATDRIAHENEVPEDLKGMYEYAHDLAWDAEWSD